jgi:hypothetical protein
MICQSCGTTNQADKKFCGRCGQALSQQASGKSYNDSSAAPATTAYGNTEYGALGTAPAASANAWAAPTESKKYKALRTIAILYKIFAFVSGGLCGIGALISLAAGLESSSRRGAFDLGSSFMAGGFFGAFLLGLYGAFLFIFFYGIGEFIYVFLDIEENTRLTNKMLSERN